MEGCYMRFFANEIYKVILQEAQSLHLKIGMATSGVITTI